MPRTRLFLLKDWTAPDGDEFSEGQILTTDSDDEAKTLLFDGVARCATTKDISPPDAGGIKSAEEVEAIVEKAVQAAIAKITPKPNKLTASDVTDVNQDGHTKDVTNEWSDFGELLLAVKAAAGPGTTIDERLLTKAASGSSESSPSDGGFFVHPTYSAEVLKRAYEMGDVLSRCRRIPIGNNTLRINRIVESSRTDGNRLGGVRGYWIGEADQKQKSKPKLGLLELSLKKLACLWWATDELLEDQTALTSIAMEAFPEEITFKTEDAVINGTGAGMPQGIMNCVAKVAVGKETSQAAATFISQNVEKMYARMWAKSVKNAVWFINQNVWPQIFRLKQSVGTGGAPMFIPAGRMADAPFGTLLGRPIVPIEYCQTLGAEGDVIFADMSQYIIADKGGVQTAQSMHLRFDYDETCYRWVYRVDGQSAWATALTPYKGGSGATQSPFITLAVRA